MCSNRNQKCDDEQERQVVDEKTALEFCNKYGWLYACWRIQRTLVDDNESIEENLERYPSLFGHLTIIVLEYLLLETCKLDDRAKLGARYNLTVQFILKHGEWGERQSRMEELASSLASFTKKLRKTRNRILAHHDLEANVNHYSMGAFDKGLDQKFFDELYEFVNIVSDTYLHTTYEPDHYMESEIKNFLKELESNA